MNLFELDQTITLAINALHSPFGDTFFWIFTKMEVWLPMFIVFIILSWRELKWRKTLLIIVGALLALLLADQACNIIKLTVCRLRPTHEPALIGLVHTVNGYVGGDYGFCSAHAANTMALMLFTSLIVRRWQYTTALSTWVLLSCWSRIYLGVHYMGDILAGLLVGVMFALLVYLLLARICKRFTSLVVAEYAPSLRQHLSGEYMLCRLSSKTANILVASYLMTVILILVYTLLNFR